MTTILTIFAGRRPNLEILNTYLRKALSDKIIDEVHFWNNTRDAQDEKYIVSTSNIKRTSSQASGRYLPLTTVIQNNGCSFSASAKSDLHARVTSSNTGSEYEVVIGALGNQYTVIRKDAVELFRIPTPDILSEQRQTKVAMQVVNGSMELVVDDEPLCMFQVGIEFRLQRIFVKTGHGSVAHLEYEEADHRGFYFMDTCEKSWKNYYEHYDHPRYHDAVILKCDDDIVFIDLQKLPTFVHYIRNADHDLVFANTINNGVSAYFQQSKYGLIPRTLMELEYPEGGLEGSLWASGKKAEALHDYFIANHERFLSEDYHGDVIPIATRFSINFFGYKGSDWWKIRDCFVDDEYNLTVDYVTNRFFQNVLYADMFVAHLSFYKQIETGIDLNKLCNKYRAMCRWVLGEDVQSDRAAPVLILPPEERTFELSCLRVRRF